MLNIIFTILIIIIKFLSDGSNAMKGFKIIEPIRNVIEKINNTKDKDNSPS